MLARSASGGAGAIGKREVNMAQKMLGEMLISRGLLDEKTLDDALTAQKESGERIGSTLLRQALIHEEVLAEVLGDQHDLEGIDPLVIEPTAEALATLDYVQTMRLGCLPMWIRDGELAVAMADPNDQKIISAIGTVTGFPLKRFVAPLMALRKAIKRAYGDASEADNGALERDDQLRMILQTMRQLVFQLEGLVGAR